MLLSVCATAFGGTLSEQIRAAGDAGFEALELRHAVDGVPLGRLDAARFSDLCGEAAEEGLTVATLALGQVAQWREKISELRHVAALSALSGARVRFHSSARPGGEALGDPPDMLYRLELDGVRTCVETIHAVHPETLVMIEPGRDSVCNTTARLAALLDDLGAPNVGINWDFVNAWRAGEHPWPEPWDHLRGRLYGVHWKGARAEPHEPRRYACHFVPGDDDIQHRSMWATWAAVGFDGPVTADPEYHFFAPRDHFDPEPERPEWVLCCTYLDKMIDYRRRAWERLVC